MNSAPRSLLLFATALFFCRAIAAQTPPQPRSMFENVSAEAKAAYEAAAIPLWQGTVPEATGDTVADRPTLYPVLPPKSGTPVAAVIVLPGGGYNYLAAHEAFPIAEHFKSAGLAAFVLQYRLKPYPDTVSLLDAQRAVRVLRSRAAEFGVDPKRIAVIGFSAGGHLAANLSTHGDDGAAKAGDAVDRQSCRVQSAMLIYPWLVFDPITRRTSADRHLDTLLTKRGLHQGVDQGTPPTFMVVGYDDDRTPYEHCLAYTAKLHEAGVKFELHVLGTGGHGFGLRGQDPRLQIWGQLATNWMITCGFLPRSQ